jgi:hypothetical protein
MMTFDDLIGQLEVARWNERTPGKRDVHTNCPVCGGSDPLHTTERNGKALVAPCFSCGAEYPAILEALDGSEPTPTVRIKKTRSREPRPAFSPAGDRVADQVGGVWKPALRQLDVSPSDLHAGLPTLAGVPAAETIILVEGHGPAIALNKASIPAVGTVTGKAGTISPVGASLLYGRRVVLSPDVGGEAHMERCGAVLAPIAAEILLAPAWPEDLVDGEDAAQYLERHGPDAMRAFYAAATPWQAAKVDLSRPVSEIERHEPEKLVDDFAHPSAHTALWGPNGSGKGVWLRGRSRPALMTTRQS